MEILIKKMPAKTTKPIPMNPKKEEESKFHPKMVTLTKRLQVKFLTEIFILLSLKYR
jgi:hypothetical protein